MKVFLGKKGLDRSWQQKFKSTTKCPECGGRGRIMFVAHEGVGEDEYIADLHSNKGNGNYWVHDACAVAVYLCKKCFEPIAIINQA
jgi:hypothetical protein